MNAYALRWIGSPDVYVRDGNPRAIHLTDEIGWAKYWPSPNHANAARLDIMLGDGLEVVKLPDELPRRGGRLRCR